MPKSGVELFHDPGPVSGFFQKTLEQAKQAKRKLEEKYPQYESTAVLREPATILSMLPTAIMSWSARRVDI